MAIATNYINFLERDKKAVIAKIDPENLSVDVILKRYYDINNVRLNRIYSALTDRQKDFLTLIPLIFHSNHASLPCFVPNCPAGIPSFTTTADMKFAASRRVKGFSAPTKSYRQFDIRAIYLMGSPGTIAYSKKSDFDFWLCYRPELSEEGIALLDQKVAEITLWADSIDLEITIFLVNSEEFLEGKSIPLSVESSGSSQHLLLLEEFYRTAILLAGLYPAWWIVPPDQEANYETYLKDIDQKRLIKNNMISSKDFINFGSVKNIPADEFLGATVWQIYKGIDSPYKSILKLMLMEAYASEFPDIELISMMYKKHVYYDAELDINTIDPYLMLLEKLTSYLSLEHSDDRLLLVRKCFYTKVDCPISIRNKSANLLWRNNVMERLVSNWDWELFSYQQLDHRNQWKLNNLIGEQKQLVDALMYGYRKLSEFFSANNNASRISRRDLHLLGRKLHAAFERKSGKIQIINRQLKPQLLETHISFHQFSRQKKELGWRVYQGIVNQKEIGNRECLNQSSHFLKLITWLFFNGAINKDTKILLTVQQGYTISKQELQWIIGDLVAIYKSNKLASASLEILSKPSYVEQSILFVNATIDPFFSFSNQQYSSNHTDSFSYGAAAKNLVLSIDLIYNTSWKEVMYFHYAGEKGVLDCICQYLNWNKSYWIHNDTQTIPYILPSKVSSYSSSRGGAIANRVYELIQDIILSFAKDENNTQRYLFMIGGSYFLLGYANNDAFYTKINSMSLLFKELSSPRSSFSTLCVDSQVKDDPNLALIYQLNESGKVQFFYFNHIKNVDIYILDDLGALYHKTQAIEQQNVHINHYILFLNSIIQRRQFSPSLDMDNNLDLNLSFDNQIELAVYKMLREQNDIKIIEQHNDLFPLPKQFLNIQAIGSTTHDNQFYFSIYCDDKEFSALDFGNNLYHEIADFVVTNRQSGLRYPIYLTDMDLNKSNTNTNSSRPTQISQLLKYKDQIEKKLNAAIKDI